MSYQATSWAWAQDVTPVQKLVLLALANYAGNEEGECWPGRDTLASMTGLSVRSVSRATSELAKQGQLAVEARARGNGSQASNIYRLSLREDTEATPPGHTVPPSQDTLSPPIEPVIRTGKVEPKSPISPNEEPVVGSFDAFWAVVWRKDNKQNAVKAYSNAMERLKESYKRGDVTIDAATIVERAQAQADLYEDDGTESRFQAHATTWLNQSRWENESLTKKNHAGRYVTDEMGAVYDTAEGRYV